MVERIKRRGVSHWDFCVRGGGVENRPKRYQKYLGTLEGQHATCKWGRSTRGGRLALVTSRLAGLDAYMYAHGEVACGGCFARGCRKNKKSEKWWRIEELKGGCVICSCGTIVPLADGNIGKMGNKKRRRRNWAVLLTPLLSARPRCWNCVS